MGRRCSAGCSLESDKLLAPLLPSQVVAPGCQRPVLILRMGEMKARRQRRTKPVGNIEASSVAGRAQGVEWQVVPAGPAEGLQALRRGIKCPHERGKFGIVELVCGGRQRKPPALPLLLLAPMAERATHVHTEHGNAAGSPRAIVQRLDVAISRYRLRRNVPENPGLLESFPRSRDEGRTAFYRPSLGHDPSPPPARRDEKDPQFAVASDAPRENADLLQIVHAAGSQSGGVGFRRIAHRPSPPSKQPERGGWTLHSRTALDTRRPVMAGVLHQGHRVAAPGS